MRAIAVQVSWNGPPRKVTALWGGDGKQRARVGESGCLGVQPKERVVYSIQG